MSEGCIIDGDPSIFTPAVCEWMVKERLHPSTVIYCTMDAQLATDRRVPNEFTWSPPVPERRASFSLRNKSIKLYEANNPVAAKSSGVQESKLEKAEGQVFDITVKVADGGGLSDTAAIKITTTATNFKPQFEITGTLTPVAELNTRCHDT